MEFSTPELAIEYESVDFRLRHVVHVFEGLMQSWYQKTMVITSVFREDKSSPHYYFRAVDVRSSLLSLTQAEHLVAAINFLCQYNKGRFSTCLWHDVGLGWHFHLQVPPLTKEG